MVWVETTWVRQRREEAKKWQMELVSQAKQGDAEAQFTLYRYSPLIGENLRWLCLAANQGYAAAQQELGHVYAGDAGQYWQDWGRLSAWKKLGVKQDYARGYMWYSLALSNGEKTAGIYRAKPAKKMTPAQIAEAERLAKEWKPDPSACDTGAATSSPMN